MNDELKKIYLDANVNVQLIRTIELYHPSFSQTWYLAQYHTTFTGKLENDSLQEFMPWGFELKLPDVTSKGQSNAQFVIDATDTTIWKELLAYMEDPTIPVILNWREYLSNSTDIQTSILNIKLMDIEFNYNSIRGAGSRPDIVNRPFPNRRYDQTVFKGLKYV